MLNAILVSRFISFFSFSAVRGMPPAPATGPVQTQRSTAKTNNRDRLFWIGLYMIWQDCKSALMIVQPETTPGMASGSDGISGSLSQSKQPWSSADSSFR
jgi:hypothetical protein